MGERGGEWLGVGAMVESKKEADDREEEEDMANRGRKDWAVQMKKGIKCHVDLNLVGYPGRALVESKGVSHPPD